MGTSSAMASSIFSATSARTFAFLGHAQVKDEFVVDLEQHAGLAASAV